MVCCNSNKYPVREHLTNLFNINIFETCQARFLTEFIKKVIQSALRFPHNIFAAVNESYVNIISGS